MKLAIFDLDHTLLRVNSSYHFGLYLYRKRQLPLKALLSMIFSYVQQRILHTPLQVLHRRHFYNFFAGRESDFFKHEATMFRDARLDCLIYPPALKRLQQLKVSGYYIVILSGSPNFLVDPIAEKLGADRGIGTDYIVDSTGRFTDVAQVMDGHDKAQVARQIAYDLGCHLNDVEAYSDSHLDLPLLQIAGKPVGVNPNWKLRNECLRNNWGIL